MDKESKEIKNYFESLGYKYSWDYSKRLGERWHEIYKDNKLIAQFDMGVPLELIKTDLSRLHIGLGFSESPIDYKLNGSGKEFDELVEKVFKSYVLTK